MNKSSKIILCYSIIYWILIGIGVLLFELAFERVPINNYGLLVNYYSSEIDREAFPSGFYHKGIGYYFILFPSSSVYLLDLEVNITTGNMESIGLTYSLVYRIKSTQLYSLYESLSSTYQHYIIAEVNGIISNYFMTFTEDRGKVQSELVTKLSSQFGSKISVLQSAIMLEGFWVEGFHFYANEHIYATTYQDSSSYSESYMQLQIQNQKTKLEAMMLNNTINSLLEELNAELNNLQHNSIHTLTQQSAKTLAEKDIVLSQSSEVSQLFKYYPGVKVVFQ